MQTSLFNPLRVAEALRPKPACFIALNPSVANESRPDPTITKDTGFVRLWGRPLVGEAGATFNDARTHRYTLTRPGFIKVNLFSFVSTDKMGMLAAIGAGEPITDVANDNAIIQAALSSDLVIACWGGPHGSKRLQKIIADRVLEVVAILDQVGVSLQCLGTSKDGHPRHPLMLAYDTPLEPWRAA